MENKLDRMLEDIQAYKDYNFKKVVEDRLDKTLKLYLEHLEDSYGRVLTKRTNKVVREFTKR